MSRSVQENTEQCKRIADVIEKYVTGDMYRDEEGIERDAEELGDAPVPEGWEPLSLYDWSEDALDHQYLIDSDGSYNSVKFLVAFGGPNIYVDTESKSVELYWWGDRATWYLSDEAIDALDELGSELYESLR